MNAQCRSCNIIEGGDQYQVFKIGNPVYSTAEGRHFYIFEVIDTNRDGIPSNGDYGLAGNGEAYCINLEGTIFYEPTDEYVSWDWVNARHRFQPTGRLGFRGDAPSKAEIAFEEAVLTVPRYLGVQYESTRGFVHEHVTEQPVLGGAIAVGVVGVGLWVRNYPAGRVATAVQYAAAAGATVGIVTFTNDRTDTLAPSAVALVRGDTTRAGNIILSDTMGEEDILLVPAMLGGASALESSATRVVAGLGRGAQRAFMWFNGGGGGGGLVPVYVDGYGSMGVFATPVDEAVTAVALAEPDIGFGVSIALSVGRGAGAPEEPDFETIFEANDDNPRFRRAYELYCKEESLDPKSELARRGFIDFIDGGDEAIHGVTFDKDGKIVEASIGRGITSTLGEIGARTRGDVSLVTRLLAADVDRVSPGQGLGAKVLREATDPAERVADIEVQELGLRILRILGGLPEEALTILR